MEKRAHILVVDDEQAIADLVGQLLVEAGFAPTVFYAAPDLLACQADDPFDLVILDIMMPGMSGIKTVQRFAQRRLSGQNFNAYRARQLGRQGKRLNAGADDYLVKPFAVAELLARLNALVRRQGSYMEESVEYKGFVLNSGDYTISYGGSKDAAAPARI